jgi:hypothetical protein
MALQADLLHGARMTESSLYVPDGDRFVSTELTRGPWNKTHQHGGPPAALLVREMERRLAAETGGAPFHPARFSMDLLRPVPIAPLRIVTETTRSGKKVRGVSATCFADDVEVVRASILFIRRAEIDARVMHPSPSTKAVADSKPYRFGFFTEPIGYHTAMEMRRAEGEWGSGALTVWMRLAVPVVPGEAPSPLQRVVVAADSGNGISAALDLAHFTFVNPDLTVYLHRPPRSEWIMLAAQTTVSAGGVGLAECALGDEEGPIGRSLQSIVVEERGR